MISSLRKNGEEQTLFSALLLPVSPGASPSSCHDDRALQCGVPRVYVFLPTAHSFVTTHDHVTVSPTGTWERLWTPKPIFLLFPWDNVLTSSLGLQTHQSPSLSPQRKKAWRLPAPHARLRRQQLVFVSRRACQPVSPPVPSPLAQPFILATVGTP